jgi:hypothetical protein
MSTLPKENENSGSISGRITIKGRPAAGFELSLSINSWIPDNRIIAKTVTDESGFYRFTDLAANHYWVKVLAPQYITGGEYDDEGPRQRVSIGDGEAVDAADLDLIRGGVVSGKVVDVDGVPVVKEWVHLYQINENKPFEWVPGYYNDDEPFWLNNSDCLTDAQGNYRLYGIPAGRYLIAVGVDFAKRRGEDVEEGGIESLGFLMIGGNRCFEETFYGSARDRLNAKAIEISLEEEVRGIEIRIPDKGWPVYSVNGRLIEEGSGKPLSGCSILIEKLSGGGYVTHKTTDENGGFEISGILKGRYFVDAYLNDQIELITDRVDFEVRDEQVTGLEIKAHPGLMMTGSIIIEGENAEHAFEKLSQSEFQVNSDKLLMGRKASISSDGSFTIIGLHKGTLGFSFSSICFSIIRIEHPGARHEVFIPRLEERWFIEMAEEDLTDVRIVLKSVDGAIKGRVNIINGRLPLGIILRAVIGRQFENGSWCTDREVDANGNFIIEGLEPGEYGVSIRWYMPWINISPIVSGGSNGSTEGQMVKVTADSEVEVLFIIDASELTKKE